MNIKSTLCFALALCVAGCTSIRTSLLHYTSLSHEEEKNVCSDLNRLLLSDGFTASRPEETPWGQCWSSSSFSPLWKERVDFQVSTISNSNGLDVHVLEYKGPARANKKLVEAITACVKSNAPRAQVSIEAKMNFCPPWAFKE